MKLIFLQRQVGNKEDKLDNVLKVDKCNGGKLSRKGNREYREEVVIYFIRWQESFY